MSENGTFEGWAIVELFGHQIIAGQVSEVSVGGNSFIRVDVPPTDEQDAFTKIYGAKAIYAITPTTEEVVYEALKRINTRPVDRWTVPDKQPELPPMTLDVDPDDFADSYEDDLDGDLREASIPF